MRSFPLMGAPYCALVLAGAAILTDACLPSAKAQEIGAPALFPIPLPSAYPVALTAGRDAADDLSWHVSVPSSAQPSPSDLPPAIETGRGPEQLPLQSPAQSPAQWPTQSPVQSYDYQAAMKGAWDSCSDSVPNPSKDSFCADAGCGPRHFVYANGLVMTRINSGGFVTSTDGGGDPALAFDSSSFGNHWHGGFELGGGCCFGGSRGLEFVYWGLYPASAEQTATGTLDSTIDLADIDYDFSDGNAIFDGAAAHRLRFDYDLHSAELNLLGNYGGPLGCGRLGYCGTGCGERWGFGWLAGFRYINYTEDWLFSAELDDTEFDNEADQLNYEVDVQNHLIGFQLGLGLDYCITHKFQVYAIGKAGIYGNAIDMQQSIYGSAGDATLNSGPLAGEFYDLDTDDFDLAMCSQIDLGGRCALSRSWSLDFGWRVLGLSGVAIAEDNVAQSNLGLAAGSGDIQTSSSVIIHGGYAGLTYAW